MSDASPSAPSPGLLLVVSSPSGAGKTTLCRRLVAEFPRMEFSVSYTTRPMRRGETDGVDYHFVTAADFEAMAERGQFAEWAEVHGNRYGTSAAAVRHALDGGGDVLFDIDYQGGRQIRERFGDEAVLVFVLPPTLDELERRLRQRATDAPEVIERRLAKAREELKQFELYDRLIVNDDLDTAYDQLRAVYLAARCDLRRQRPVAERLAQEADRRGRAR